MWSKNSFSNIHIRYEYTMHAHLNIHCMVWCLCIDTNIKYEGRLFWLRSRLGVQPSSIEHHSRELQLALSDSMVIAFHCSSWWEHIAQRKKVFKETRLMFLTIICVKPWIDRPGYRYTQIESTELPYPTWESFPIRLTTLWILLIPCVVRSEHNPKYHTYANEIFKMVK